MTFIEKVKESVELTTGCRFYYHAAGELNEVLAGVEIGEDPIAFAYLLKGGDVSVGKNCREGVNLAVFFCKKTEFDFNSYENEQLIDECKQIAFAWVSWFSKSNTLEIVGNVTTERVYDTTTDILTGIAVNITLRELVGYGICDIKKPVLIIEKNGVYTLGAYDVKVDVLPKNVDLLAKNNGTYLPSEYGVDAFRKVDVDVPQLGWKMVYRDGTIGRFYAKKIGLSLSFYNNKGLVEFDTSTYKIDTSDLYDMTSFLSKCPFLTKVNFTGIDTSNVIYMDYFFNGIGSQSVITGLNTLDTSNVTHMKCFLSSCYNLVFVDFSSFNVSKVTSVVEFFRDCNNLHTIIGEHTLEDVENGLTTFFGLRVSINIGYSPYLRFSSMLAMLNGFADMTGEKAQTLNFNKKSWGNMYNDDDTIPDADTIAERQARLSAIAAQKNWTIVY